MGLVLLGKKVATFIEWNEKVRSCGWFICLQVKDKRKQQRMNGVKVENKYSTYDSCFK